MPGSFQPQLRVLNCEMGLVEAHMTHVNGMAHSRCSKMVVIRTSESAMCREAL